MLASTEAPKSYTLINNLDLERESTLLKSLGIDKSAIDLTQEERLNIKADVQVFQSQFEGLQPHQLSKLLAQQTEFLRAELFKEQSNWSQLNFRMLFFLFMTSERLLSKINQKVIEAELKVEHFLNFLNNKHYVGLINVIKRTQNEIFSVQKQKWDRLAKQQGDQQSQKINQDSSDQRRIQENPDTSQEAKIQYETNICNRVKLRQRKKKK